MEATVATKENIIEGIPQLLIQMKSPPSKCTRVYWHIAHAPFRAGTGNGQSLSRNIGKFQIFEPRQYIDQSWERIKIATEAGQLGCGSKVSTRRRKPEAIGFKKNEGVIIVYARDSNDENEKERIRESLYRLGYTEHLPYKTDQDTFRGVYSRHTQPSGSDTIVSEDSKHQDQPSSEERGQKRNAEDEMISEPGPSKVVKKGSSAVLDIKGEDPEAGCSGLQQSPAPMTLVRQRNIYPPTVGWKSMNYIRVYITQQPFTPKRHTHIKQEYPVGGSKPPDILFPFEQMKDVADSIYKLGRTFPESEATVVQGIETSHVKLILQFSKEHEKFCIFICGRYNMKVFFPQTEFRYYFNRIEYIRKRDEFGDPEYSDHGIKTDTETELESDDESENSDDDGLEF